MKIKLEITEQDIIAGLRGSCGLCPIARAMARHQHKFRGATWVDASPAYLTYYGEPGKEYDPHHGHMIAYATTPTPCKDFMMEFDSGDRVYPFTIEIEFKVLPDVAEEDPAPVLESHPHALAS